MGPGIIFLDNAAVMLISYILSQRGGFRGGKRRIAILATAPISPLWEFKYFSHPGDQPLISPCCKVIDFKKGFPEPLLYCEQNRDAHGFSGMSKLIDFPSSHHAILNIRFGNLEDFDIRFFKEEERYVESIFQPTLALTCCRKRERRRSGRWRQSGAVPC